MTIPHCLRNPQPLDYFACILHHPYDPAEDPKLSPCITPYDPAGGPEPCRPSLCPSSDTTPCPTSSDSSQRSGSNSTSRASGKFNLRGHLNPKMALLQQCSSAPCDLHMGDPCSSMAVATASRRLATVPCQGITVEPPAPCFPLQATLQTHREEGGAR